MRYRLDIMEKEGLTLKDIQAAIDTMSRCRGARDGGVAARALPGDHPVGHVLRVRMPFMKKLGEPTLFCHKLEVEPATQKITDFHMRLQDPKRKCVNAFRLLNFKTIATGDLQRHDDARRRRRRHPLRRLRQRHRRVPAVPRGLRVRRAEGGVPQGRRPAGRGVKAQSIFT